MAGNRLLPALWASLGAQVLGRLLDLRWHLANDEFEGASQQLEAHWLIWLAVIATIAVAALALRRDDVAAGRSGFRVVLASGVLYAAVAVWHFVEHANGVDPELAHYLLVVTEAGMFAGALMATLALRRQVAAKPLR